MNRRPQKYKYWTEDELYFAYASYLSKKSVSSIARKLGRTTQGTFTALHRLKVLVNGRKLSTHETYSQIFVDVAKKIRKEIDELGKPEISHLKKEPVIAETMVIKQKTALDTVADSFSDYIDEVKHNLVRYAVSIAEEAIKESQLEITNREKQLLKRAEAAERQVEELKPLVEVAKKENTRSMLEKMLNTFRVSK
jgi:hypothetical protein